MSNNNRFQNFDRNQRLKCDTCGIDSTFENGVAVYMVFRHIGYMVSCTSDRVPLLMRDLLVPLPHSNLISPFIICWPSKHNTENRNIGVIVKQIIPLYHISMLSIATPTYCFGVYSYLGCQPNRPKSVFGP